MTPPVEPLLITNISVGGAPRRDLMIVNQRIAPSPIHGTSVIDGSRLTALPGLIDHHMHILATAAMEASIDLSGCKSETEVAAALRNAASDGAKELRAVGYDSGVADLPDRHMLDRWLPNCDLRLQDRTGALWVLNSRFVAQLGSGPFPAGVECDAQGAPTGRIWRNDQWLRERLGTKLPTVDRLVRRLLRFGVTGATDASFSNGAKEAMLFERMLAAGDWPLRLQLMGSEDLPSSDMYLRGPLKLHFEDSDLPHLDAIVARVRHARQQGRAVATHCVTETQLAWFLAALEEAEGALPGDRVEHGAMIFPELLAQLAETPLAVVSNPGFILTRGDRYLRSVPQSDHPSLYRLRSLQAAGLSIHVASDAPYGPLDPWRVIQAARDRRTASGVQVGRDESIAVEKAIASYCHCFDLSALRTLAVGDTADICLLRGSFEDIVNDPSAERVVATLVGGRALYASSDEYAL